MGMVEGQTPLSYVSPGRFYLAGDLTNLDPFIQGLLE